MERAVEFLLVIGNCSDVVEDEPGTDRGHGVREFHLHLQCFAAWEIERKLASE